MTTLQEITAVYDRGKVNRDHFLCKFNATNYITKDTYFCTVAVKSEDSGSSIVSSSFAFLVTQLLNT